MNQDGSDPRAWGRAQAIYRLQELQQAVANREPVDIRAALTEVDQIAARFAGDSQLQMLAKVTRVVLGLGRGISFADVPEMREVLQEMKGLLGDRPDPTGGMMPGLLNALELYQNGDTSTSLASLSEVLSRSDSLPESSFFRQQLEETAPAFELMRMLHEDEADRDPAKHRRLLDEVRSLAARPGITEGERSFYLTLAGGAAFNQGIEQDEQRMDAGVADLRDAVARTADDHPEHVVQLASLALAVYRRSEVTGSLQDVNESIDLLEKARSLAGGPPHPHWSFVNSMLADFSARRPQKSNASADSSALDALRGYTWQVLLQPDPGTARSVARDAANEAMDTARRFLTGGDPGGALQVLDAGRGLALFAATELRDPSKRLLDAGAEELEKRWRAAERPSARLREEVVEVLSRETDLLDPPTLEEIQEALGRLGADALVYLVPATSPAPGWAVIAPAEGPPGFLTLPNLAVKGKLELERYLAAARNRDVVSAPTREIDSDQTTEFADSLDSLCSWAWKAAIGPIVEQYFAGVTDRPLRLVLIPMGELARVPWQAARRPDGKYLVELAAVSQAASSRMLCASAAAAPVRRTASGLMVADPKTGTTASDLQSARLEAYAIHRTFYPGATYVGRRPDGTVSGSGSGTPEQVISWLQADGAHAGAMAHFATHGVISTDPAGTSSRLLLAGGDLTAEQLIRILDTGRHPLGLVVLAGCHTGESIYGYDEAYSLGTVFLAAGARSVLSTQWSIPDQDTSLLMYMFHHFLITKTQSPSDALREAQRWMLDGARDVPESMPAPLRRMLADADLTQVVSWAGFVHWGQ